MAMEMLKGSTLEEFNKTKTRLGFEEIIEFARQIARGLGARSRKRDCASRHQTGQHLDRGGNQIGSRFSTFGLALASTPVDHLAGRGAVIGTPGYLSPEQARSEPLDDRSDLYSMGVVLYELCTGQLPIQSKSVPGQLISILAHRPTPINEINPDIPQPLCDLIHRLLRKEPRTRPSSAAKLEAGPDPRRRGMSCQERSRTGNQQVADGIERGCWQDRPAIPSLIPSKRFRRRSLTRSQPFQHRSP